jgi:hypothetical protein
MEFETRAQQEIYEKVLPWVAELQIGVFPWSEADAVITTRSYVVTGAELTPELMRYLLTENAGMRFGAFGLDEEGDIIFEHTIVGSTCDQKELESSVVHVARTADDYDDLIVERWGGERALDQVR